jgi:excisionase family DNA binding protein
MNEPTKSETPERAMNVRQVAERYGVAQGRIYKWIADGHLPYLRLPGGDYRFKACHLEEFERRCEAKDSSDQTSDSASPPVSEEYPGTSTGPTIVSARASRDFFKLGQAVRAEADRKRQQREVAREERRQAHVERAVARARKSRGADPP